MVHVQLVVVRVQLCLPILTQIMKTYDIIFNPILLSSLESVARLARLATSRPPRLHPDPNPRALKQRLETKPIIGQPTMHFSKLSTLDNTFASSIVQFLRLTSCVDT